MHILVTGANGYIGQRLIPALLDAGHQLYCCVRDKHRFAADNQSHNIRVIEIDFLNPMVVAAWPPQIDVAFYLVHSMSTGKNFETLEKTAAQNFINAIEKTSCRQVIYLSGIVNERQLSPHLRSRLAVENILRSSCIPLTVLRAGIIVGSGSASFEIIRDLVEKLPVMITPRWLNTLCQPIAIRNVIQFLCGVMLRETCFDKDFDIGGPVVLSYKQMLLQFAAVRKLKRFIITLPVMTPKISSYWLYFITSTSFPLAVNLVDSMKVNVICRPNQLADQLGIELLPYKSAVELAFQKIEQQLVLSSWKDAFSAANTNLDVMQYADVPVYGCFRDAREKIIDAKENEVLDNIWSIGGQKGWYYANTLWKLRGIIDKAFGGVGLRRGRTNTRTIDAGDALDFWRVLIADRVNQRLLLFAEMKLPGEAWLEFKIIQKDQHSFLQQTATFRPKGVWGRIYWYLMVPFHFFIFRGMLRRLSMEIT